MNNFGGTQEVETRKKFQFVDLVLGISNRLLHGLEKAEHFNHKCLI